MADDVVAVVVVVVIVVVAKPKRNPFLSLLIHSPLTREGIALGAHIDRHLVTGFDFGIGI